MLQIAASFLTLMFDKVLYQRV